VLGDPDLPAGPRLDALVLRSISLAQLGDMDGCLAVLEDACKRIAADPAIDPHDPTAITAGCNFAIYLALVGNVPRALTAAEDSLRRAQAFGGPSTLSLAHYAVGFAYLDLDPTRAAASFEEALRFSDLGASNIVRDRSMSMLALVAWRGGDTPEAAHHIGRALSESFAMGDYSSCAYMLDLAVPILGDGERWHAALVVDHALTDGTLSVPAVNNQGIAEARKRAVAASRGTLGVVSADRGDASRDRDAIVRYAIAELETLAEG